MTSETTPTPDLSAVRVAAAAALDRKAIELRVLDLHTVSDFTEFFLICGGASDRQVQAIADAIVRRLRKAGRRPLHIEGHKHGRWVLIDYGDFVAHVFDEKTRAFYALERLWADGTDVTTRVVS
jgi:ribosome-associated protein